MSEAPERIWISKVYGQHPEDWDFTDGRHLTKKQLKAKVEYIRADRIEQLAATNEELEAKLAKAVEELQGLVPILCEGVEDGCGKLSRHDCAACEGYATLAALSSVSCANLKGQGDG